MSSALAMEILPSVCKCHAPLAFDRAFTDVFYVKSRSWSRLLLIGRRLLHSSTNVILVKMILSHRNIVFFFVSIESKLFIQFVLWYKISTFWKDIWCASDETWLSAALICEGGTERKQCHYCQMLKTQDFTEYWKDLFIKHNLYIMNT